MNGQRAKILRSKSGLNRVSREAAHVYRMGQTGYKEINKKQIPMHTITNCCPERMVYKHLKKEYYK